MSYELLDHTADVKFRATGDTWEDAFGSVVDAFHDIVTLNDEEYQVEGEVSISVESENHEALLFDFLDRMIFTQDVEGVLIVSCRDIEIQEKGDKISLDATLDTVPIKSGMELLDIKAPTYNDMEAENMDGEVILVAVLDI